MREVEVILHTSDSAFGNAALITQWHTFPAVAVIQNGRRYIGRGWDDIGYHYVILNGWLRANVYNALFDGHVETGRALDGDQFVSPREAGAHVRGRNAGTVGVCLIGLSGKHTPKQIQGLYGLLFSLEKQFGRIRLSQHSDYDPAKPLCAGLDMEKVRAEYATFKTQQNAGVLNK